MKGGENGPVIVAGDPDRSDLFRRIALPEDHEDFMPKDGKTPLTAQQTAAIRWWISIGAPPTAAIASLTPSAEDRAALESVLGFGSGTAQPTGQQVAGNSTAPVVNVPPPDAKVVEALESNGFVVRPIASDSPLVQVDFTATRALTDADFTELAKIAPQIYALNLRAAGVIDSQLTTIGKFENLAHLRLELNPISDAGMPALADLKNLDYLNLYGTRITDKGVETLSRMEKLHTLFVWKTGVTDKGVAAIKNARADLQVDGGFDPSSFPVGPKVIPVVN
jgi:hypothetical protein